MAKFPPLRKLFPIALALISVTALWAGPALAANHTVAPRDRAVEADFESLREALDSGKVKAGDRIVLLHGDHGPVELIGYQFTRPVEILADGEGRTHLDKLEVYNSRNLTFSGFSIWPKQAEGDNRALVFAEGNTSDLVFDRLDIRSIEAAAGYARWSRDDWFRFRKMGVLTFGDDTEIRNSRVLGTSFGIAANGDRSRVTGNIVAGFSGDGMRAGGAENVIMRNRIQDCVRIDENHDDGFQAWSQGPDGASGEGILEGLVLDGNEIFEWIGPQQSALVCVLQGIGLYDGMYNRLVIRNNVIVNTSHHGIAVWGMTKGLVVNNTLANRIGPSSDAPWIGIFLHKKGYLSDGVVANNVTPRIAIEDAIKPRITLSANIVTPSGRELVAPRAGDLRARPGTAMIDRADPRYAPATDIRGMPRPQGSGPDIGAHELKP